MSFIPEVWSSAVKENLRGKIVFQLQGVADRAYEGDATFGNKVHVLRPDNISSGVTTGYYQAVSTANVSSVDTEVAIDKRAWAGFKVDNLVQKQANPALVDAFARDAASAIAQQIEKEVSQSVLLAGTTIPKNKAAFSSDAYGTILSLAEALDDAGVPTEGRWLIVHPALKTLIMSDPSVRQMVYAGQNVVADGSAPMVGGFALLTTPNMYKDTTNNKYYALAGHSYGLALILQNAPESASTLLPASQGLHVYEVTVAQPFGYKVVYAPALAALEVQF